MYKENQGTKETQSFENQDLIDFSEGSLQNNPDHVKMEVDEVTNFTPEKSVNAERKNTKVKNVPKEICLQFGRAKSFPFTFHDNFKGNKVESLDITEKEFDSLLKKEVSIWFKLDLSIL